MDIAKINRADLEVAVLENDSLEASLDADRFYGRNGASKYTDDELRAAISAWIADGDECASA